MNEKQELQRVLSFIHLSIEPIFKGALFEVACYELILSTHCTHTLKFSALHGFIHHTLRHISNKRIHVNRIHRSCVEPYRLLIHIYFSE